MTKKVSSNSLGKSYFVENYTFSGIQNVVNSASAGDTIVLSGTYVGNGTQILVSKKLTFKSIGETILDGKNSSRAFNITGKNVTINNLTFINCLGNTYGGAIYWPGANGVLDNCTFMNNYGTINAGAVNWPGANGTLMNCNFVNNSGNYSGAVFWGGVNGSVKNCIFIDNSALYYCGAIYFLGNSTSIYNCSFVNNSADGGNGGALIWSGSYGELKNCSFVNNSANSDDNGGAVYWFGVNGSVLNCSFIDNSADFGGAVYWSAVNGSVLNCSFSNNSAAGYGGAISWSWDANGSVVNCTFLNNAANNIKNGDSRGGAIDWNGVNGSVLNCSFANNSARAGSTIHWNGVNGSVMGCSFVNSSFSSSYGAIWWTAVNGYLFNSSFVNSSLNNYAGAVYWSGVNGSIVSCSFVNNSAELAGAVYWYGVNGSVKNCSFLNNSAENATIYNEGNFLTIYNSTFVNNGDIAIWNKKSLFLENNTISNFIYNNGSISSKTYIMILGNSVKESKLNASIYAIITDDNDNRIITNQELKLIVLDNIEINATQTELGVWSARYSFEEPGDYLISANRSVVGFENLGVHVGIITVASDSNLNIIVDSLNYGNIASINFTLMDDGGNLVNANISVFFNNVNYTVEVLNGRGSLSCTDLMPNEYYIFAYYGGDKNHNPSVAYSQFKVSKKATQIIYENMVTTAVDQATDGRVGEYFNFKLTDSEGNPIVGVPMQIGFLGVVYDEKYGIITDENGIARLQINLGWKNDYTFAICFLGNDQYNASFVVAKIMVNPQKGSLTVPNKSYSASAKTKTLTATFKSASGKPVAGKTIKFTVNGKTYTAKTNAKGVASVNVSLTKKGTYSFTAKFTTNGMYETMTKTAKLTIK